MNLARSFIEPKRTPSLRRYWRKACCIARSAGRHGGDCMFATSSAQSKGIDSDCTKRIHGCRRAAPARWRPELTVPKRDHRRRGQCDAGGDPPIDPSCLTGRAGILDDRAEQLPALAVELHHLHLLVDAVIGRRGVGHHAGQRQAAGDVLQLAACRMMFSRVRSSPERAYPEIMLKQKVERDDDKSSRSTPARAESARAPPAPPAHKVSAGSQSLRHKRRPRSRRAEKIL